MLAANSKFSKAVYEPSRPLAAAGVRGSQDGFSTREPKPTVTLCGWDRALDVAGDATELKCTSEEFLFSFRERCERPFQRFRFCEERSAVVVFFLEAAGEAHLQSISGKGVWLGRLHPRPPDRVWAGGGEGFVWDQPPDPWRWAPCPPGAGPPRPTGQAAWG